MSEASVRNAEALQYLPLGAGTGLMLMVNQYSMPVDNYYSTVVKPILLKFFVIPL